MLRMYRPDDSSSWCSPDRQARDMAADILHAHGAEFVGFYGRWAYESLPHSSPRSTASAGRTYDISVVRDTIRIRLAEDSQPYWEQHRCRRWRHRSAQAFG